MKKTTRICDKCGKEITVFDLYENHIEFTLHYWHGGSIGGSEDDVNFDFDLCSDCARELNGIIKNWLNGK